MSAGVIYETWGERSVAPVVGETLEDLRAVCETAVDPLEIASALEFDGMSDATAAMRYGLSDVFVLAEAMHRRVPRRFLARDDAVDASPARRSRPAMRGALFGLPALCAPAVTGLIAGRGSVPLLVVALVLSWSASQGLAALGYERLGTAGRERAARLLRTLVVAGAAALALAITVAAALLHVESGVLALALAQVVYMLSAAALLVLGDELWLLAALAPSVLASTIFIASGRPPGWREVVWQALALTPLLALAMATLRHRSSSEPEGVALAPTASEVRAAALASGWGGAAAGLMVLPILVAAHVAGGDTGAVLGALPISLSMGAAEWSLACYRRRTDRLLRGTGEVAAFRRAARHALGVAVAPYTGVTTLLMAAVVAVAAATHAARLEWRQVPGMAVYLELGPAMFLALAAQAHGLRTVPFVAGVLALSLDLALRAGGPAGQAVAAGAMLVTLGSYAAIELGKVVRHGW
jgi:hypothetical protein